MERIPTPKSECSTPHLHIGTPFATSIGILIINVNRRYLCWSDCHMSYHRKSDEQQWWYLVKAKVHSLDKFDSLRHSPAFESWNSIIISPDILWHWNFLSSQGGSTGLSLHSYLLWDCDLSQSAKYKHHQFPKSSWRLD